VVRGLVDSLLELLLELLELLLLLLLLELEDELELLSLSSITRRDCFGQSV